MSQCVEASMLVMLQQQRAQALCTTVALLHASLTGPDLMDL